MIDSKRILPECYADTLLIELMGFKKPFHCNNINEVAKNLRKSTYNKAIGIVDLDKRMPKYFEDNFDTLQKSAFYTIKKHQSKEQFLIIAKPAMEGMLIAVADELNIESKFTSINKLKRITKSSTCTQNNELKQFINQLIQKKASPLKAMKQFIEKTLA